MKIYITRLPKPELIDDINFYASANYIYSSVIDFNGAVGDIYKQAKGLNDMVRKYKRATKGLSYWKNEELSNEKK